MGKRLAAWAIIATVGVVVPALLGGLRAITPDSMLRESDAGRFVSSTTSGGGFLSEPVSSVQTTAGSIAVYGPVSAVRGQRIWVEDRLKSGLQLCMDGSPPACIRLAGAWSGPLRAVPSQRHAFTWLVASISGDALAKWFLWGLLWAFVAGVFMLTLGSIAVDAEDGQK